MTRDPFGFIRQYYTAEREGSTIRELLGADRTLDMVAIDAHLAGRSEPERTCFAAVRAAPLGPQRAAAGDGAAALRAAIARIIETAPRPLAVALSGGLDSAIILALVRELDRDVEAIVLAPQVPGYNEHESAVQTLRHVGGSRLRVVEVSADDIRDATPDAIAAFETPLYNLHPVGKWLLARAARANGVGSMISGDGADQVFTRDTSADYLPLTSAAFAAAGVPLYTPFLDDDVVARVLAAPPDPDKRILRELGATLPIPDALVRDRKVSRLAPPIDLRVPSTKLTALATRLGRELPVFDDDRTYVRWTTLALLLDTFEAWP